MLIDDFFDIFLTNFMDNAEKMLEEQGGKYFAGENVSNSLREEETWIHSERDITVKLYDLIELLRR